MIKKLEKLKKMYGSAQVCVWLGIQDTRTLNTWLSRGSVPKHMENRVRELVNERRNK